MCHFNIVNQFNSLNDTCACECYLEGIIVHLLAFFVSLVRHQPGLEQILIETITQATHRHVICNTQTQGICSHKPTNRLPIYLLG